MIFWLVPLYAGKCESFALIAARIETAGLRTPINSCGTPTPKLLPDAEGDRKNACGETRLDRVYRCNYLRV